MQADLLCSGSKGNSCLIRSEGASLLIDCGSTKRHLVSSLREVNSSIDSVDGVLITHAHTDHISQLKHFAHKPIYSWCDLKVEKNTVCPGQKLEIGPFQVTVIGLSHDAPHTVGYVIEDGKRRLVYITDTGIIKNADLPLLANADAYIFESNHDVKMLMETDRPMFLKQRILSDSGHLCNEDSAKYLSQLVSDRTKHIILAHLSDQANTPALALEAFHDGFARRGLSQRGLDVRAARQFKIERLNEF